MVVSSFHRSLPWLSAPCPPPFLRVSLRLVSCLLRFHSTRSARPVGEEDVRRTTRRKSGEYRSGTGEIKCQEADHLGSRPSVTHGPRSVRSVPLVPHFLHSSSVPLPRSLPPSPSPPGGRRPGDGCRTGGTEGRVRVGEQSVGVAKGTKDTSGVGSRRRGTYEG